MTVKELRDKLYRFEDNLPVYIANAHKPEPSKKRLCKWNFWSRN